MSGDKNESLSEARIRDAMEAIRERIVRPVQVGTKQFYVYEPGYQETAHEAYIRMKGKKNATD